MKLSAVRNRIPVTAAATKYDIPNSTSFNIRVKKMRENKSDNPIKNINKYS